jgi:hypothetical protein
MKSKRKVKKSIKNKSIKNKSIKRKSIKNKNIKKKSIKKKSIKKKRSKLGEFVKKEEINIFKLPDETVGIIGKAAPGQKNVPDFVYGIKPFFPGMEIYLDSILPNKENEYCKVDTKPENMDTVYFTKGVKNIYTKFMMTRDLKNPDGPWLIYGDGVTNKEIIYDNSKKKKYIIK